VEKKICNHSKTLNKKRGRERVETRNSMVRKKRERCRMRVLVKERVFVFVCVAYCVVQEAMRGVMIL